MWMNLQQFSPLHLDISFRICLRISKRRSVQNDAWIISSIEDNRTMRFYHGNISGQHHHAHYHREHIPYPLCDEALFTLALAGAGIAGGRIAGSHKATQVNNQDQKILLGPGCFGLLSIVLSYIHTDPVSAVF